MEFLSKLRYGGMNVAEVLALRNEYRLQQWAQVVKECNASGLSNREYCRQNNIPEKTYYYWIRKLRQTAAEQMQPEPTLVPLEPEFPEKETDMLQIRFHGAELVLPASVDLDAVAAVLKSIQTL